MIGIMEVSEGVPIMQKTRTTTNAVDGDFLSYNAEDDLGELDLTRVVETGPPDDLLDRQTVAGPPDETLLEMGEHGHSGEHSGEHVDFQTAVGETGDLDKQTAFDRRLEVQTGDLLDLETAVERPPDDSLDLVAGQPPDETLLEKAPAPPVAPAPPPAQGAGAAPAGAGGGAAVREPHFTVKVGGGPTQDLHVVQLTLEKKKQIILKPKRGTGAAVVGTGGLLEIGETPPDETPPDETGGLLETPQDDLLDQTVVETERPVRQPARFAGSSRPSLLETGELAKNPATQRAPNGQLVSTYYSWCLPVRGSLISTVSVPVEQYRGLCSSRTVSRCILCGNFLQTFSAATFYWSLWIGQSVL